MNFFATIFKYLLINILEYISYSIGRILTMIMLKNLIIIFLVIMLSLQAILGHDGANSNITFRLT